MSSTIQMPAEVDEARRRPFQADPAELPEGGAKLKGEVRDVSVLMADLRGFTTFCEQATPSHMATVLDQYLTAMSQIVRGGEGHVQDFFGDGILAVFGAPQPDPDHAWHAVSSAIEMQAAIRRLSGRWEQEGGIGFRLGVAVHSGQVYAGAVGPPQQRKYAVVGDAVNTVARLEDLNRRLRTAIVVSGSTRARLGNRVETHARGTFAVRGRQHPVDVFEVLGPADGTLPGAIPEPPRVDVPRSWAMDVGATWPVL